MKFCPVLPEELKEWVRSNPELGQGVEAFEGEDQADCAEALAETMYQDMHMNLYAEALPMIVRRVDDVDATLDSEHWKDAADTFNTKKKFPAEQGTIFEVLLFVPDTVTPEMD